MYLDLVACGPGVDRSVSAMPMNILARVVTLDCWEDGIARALDELLREGTEAIIENPKWPGVRGQIELRSRDSLDTDRR
jgi:hypothetical protein